VNQKIGRKQLQIDIARMQMAIDAKDKIIAQLRADIVKLWARIEKPALEKTE